MQYTYDKGNLSTVQRTNNGKTQAYNFTYDIFGNMLTAKVGSRTLSTNVYTDSFGPLVQQTYGNGDVVNFTYDNLGRTKTVTYDDGRVLTYVYNGEGQLHSLTETNGSNVVQYLYTYDSIGRLIHSERKENGNSVLRTSQNYNANNQLTGQGWQLGSTAYSEGYTYNSADGSLNTMTTGVGTTLTMGYDGLRRLTSVTGGPVTRQYTYRDIDSTKTTLQVASVTSGGQQYGYTYDSMGNIATYSAPGKGTITYTYDNQGQLLSAAGDTTYTYTYDGAGNILTANGHTYTYGDATWKDLLTAFDGNSISYDAIGNPTSYYNGTRWTMSWTNGRSLATASDGTNSLSFAYDAGGLRTSKTVNGTTYRYYYASGKLMRMTWGTNTIDFFYDANGTPYAMKYNGTVYYYVTNLQGDVMRIVNASGAVIASYDYDPYGKVISATGTLANINPLRYRGYVYDQETALYYVSSRYYDPEIGRWINADAVDLLGANGDFASLNLFAYCGNNPVSRADSSGYLWTNILIGAVVGAVAGVVGQVISDVVTSVLNGEVTISNWQTYTGAAVGGAAGGVVLATTGNMNAANAVTGTVTTGVGQSLEKLTIKNYNKSWAEIGVNAAVDGAVSYGLGKIPGIKGATAGRNSWSAVYKSGLTKLRNGTAARMSAKVVAKGLGSSIVGGFALDGYYGVKQHAYDRVKSLLN